MSDTVEPLTKEQVSTMFMETMLPSFRGVTYEGAVRLIHTLYNLMHNGDGDKDEG